MKKKLYIHIGLPKSGSTTIQNACVKYKEKLLEHGILYPQPHLPHTGHIFFSEYANKGHDYHTSPRVLFEQLYAKMEKSPAHSVLISSESFCFESPTFLKRLTDKFEQVHIIYYVRNIFSYTNSLLQEAIKQPHAHSYNATLASIGFNDKLKIWIDTFGKENFHAKNFDKIVKEENIITDFFNTMNVHIEEECKSHSNIGLKYKYSLFLYHINMLPIEKEDLNKIIHELYKISSSDSDCEKFSILPPNFLEDYQTIIEERIAFESEILKDSSWKEHCFSVYNSMKPYPTTQLPLEVQEEVFSKLSQGTQNIIKDKIASIQYRLQKKYLLPNHFDTLEADLIFTEWHKSMLILSNQKKLLANQVDLYIKENEQLKEQLADFSQKLDKDSKKNISSRSSNQVIENKATQSYISIASQTPISLFQTFKNIIFQPILKKNAFMHCNLGNLGLAESIAQNIIANNPTTAWAYYILGKVQWQSGEKLQAHLTLQKAIGLEPQTQYFKTYLESKKRESQLENAIKKQQEKQKVKQKKYYLSILAIAKNEAPYIEEWLDYHISMGVEHFYLYDNESEDNFYELLVPYIEKGYVTYTYWPGKAQQTLAYNDALAKYKNSTRWMAVIDIDEFICPQEKISLQKFLKPYEKYVGLCIHWVNFDSNGWEKKPEGGVLENYTRVRDDYKTNVHHNIKSIVNPLTVKSFATHKHLHLNNEFPVDENFSYVFDSEKVHPHIHFDGTINKIRINHYQVKSREEVHAKMNRGDVTTGKRKRLELTDEKFVNFADTTHDFTILKHLKNHVKNYKLI